ncbi:MAG TPA: pentapeptide repeat-containing protein [Acidimicrobiales bacterium]|nr:pentapeptide repeat-containing protein [Acidimicrobiales bacterium]
MTAHLAGQRVPTFRAHSLAMAGLFISSALGVLTPLAADARQQQPPPTADRKVEAEIAKLEAETEKLRAERRRDSGVLGWLVRGVPLATGAVAVIGLILTWRKQLEETRQAREAARDEREKEATRREQLERDEQRLREQELRERERERLQRFDEMWGRALENLASAETGCQAIGAASLRAFVQPRYADMIPEIFDVIRANLRLPREPVIYDLLRPSFERALRTCLEAGGLEGTLDLTNLHLDGVNFERLDLSPVVVDIAFAHLRHANLTGTRLRGLLGYEAHLDKALVSHADLQEARMNRAVAPEALFHGATLVSTTFKNAVLSGAEFNQAKMQSAHFEGAQLQKASFAQANINDTFFRGAVFDDASLRSIVNAFHWREAHFDDDVRSRLEVVAADRHAKGVGRDPPQTTEQSPTEAARAAP